MTEKPNKTMERALYLHVVVFLCWERGCGAECGFSAAAEICLSASSKSGGCWNAPRLIEGDCKAWFCLDFTKDGVGDGVGERRGGGRICTVKNLMTSHLWLESTLVTQPAMASESSHYTYLRLPHTTAVQSSMNFGFSIWCSDAL